MATSKRIDWVDGVKGLAIVLVVYGHVAGGLDASGVLKPGSPFLAARDWVYLFHMPVFFLVSGLLAHRTIDRPWRTFIDGRLRTIVYPYVLWTGIYLAAQVAMARFANNPPDFIRVGHFLWEPYGYGLWFLYCLFLISLAFYGLMRLKLPKSAILFVALALHLAAWFNLFGFWTIFNTAMLNLIFYVLGGLYAEQIFSFVKKKRSVVAIIAGILLLILMTLLHQALGSVDLPLALLFGLPGIAGLILLFAGWFTVLGFYSLEIYLGHPLFSIAARAALGRCHIHNSLAYVLAGVSAGVLLSLGIAIICAKMEFPWLFRWPTAAKAKTES